MPLGDIAQLGERVLCKHEVVGSIPSVSTILLGLGAVRTAAAEGGCRGRYLDHEFAAAMIDEDRQVRLIVLFGEDISDIVKRECGRQARESV